MKFKAPLFLFLALVLSTQTLFAQASKSVVVFAASSLSQSHIKLGKIFEKSNTDVKIRFVFSSSATLATQIREGAKADIYISASPQDMKTVSDGKNYLVNKVVLAVPINSKVSKMSQLNDGITWIRCSNEIPCGRAAQRALAAEHVTSKPASLEPMATSVISKLLAGEVDAAIVYKTDVMAHSEQIRAIQFKSQSDAKTQYQIANLTKSKDSTKFYEFLLSKNSKQILQGYGFEIR